MHNDSNDQNSFTDVERIFTRLKSNEFSNFVYTIQLI